MAVEPYIRDLRHDPMDQMIPELCLFFLIFFHGSQGKLHSLSKPHDPRHVFRTGPALSLLCAAVDKGSKLQPLPDIKEAHALGAVELVGAGAEHVDMKLIHVDGLVAVGLDRVRMEQDAVLLCHFADLPDGLDGTDLIIGEHHGDQDRIRTDRLF